MKRTAFPRLLALALLPLGLAVPPLEASTAGTGAYQVEVLIFRAVTPPAGEDLAQPAEGRGFTGQGAGQAAAQSAGAAPGDAAPAVLRTLDSSQMQLGTMASRLRASGEYTVLAHAAWVQTATDWPRHDGLTLEQLGINVPALRGTVYLEHGQYLHLGFDLQLGSAPAWSLRELRKIRFNEKNYFDHPGYGVIAIVSPARAAT
ncbi:MAG TPA: CsiV family protein [Steroidobacteraceae bacterium]|nr:CsiV family protein [Steroidobacteraceae bacterium]